MLGDQEYDGHLSIHDDKMAEDLGFSGAPIEGPTHFSQFVPLLHEVFGDEWFTKGCISAHYQNMVVEGEEVQTMVEKAPDSSGMVAISAQKRDGTPVLTEQHLWDRIMARLNWIKGWPSSDPRLS